MTDTNKRVHNADKLSALIQENFKKEDYKLRPTYNNELPLPDVATLLRDRRNFINRIKATDLYKKTYTDEDLSAEFETAVYEKAKRFAFCKEKYSFTDLLKMRDDYAKAVKSLRKKSDLFPADITFPVRTTLLALDLAIDYRKKSALKSADLGILGVVK